MLSACGRAFVAEIHRLASRLRLEPMPAIYGLARRPAGVCDAYRTSRLTR